MRIAPAPASTFGHDHPLTWSGKVSDQLFVRTVFPYPNFGPDRHGHFNGFAIRSTSVMPITPDTVLCDEMWLPVKLCQCIESRVGDQYNIAPVSSVAATWSTSR
jgi:hypothetical protein